MAGIVRGRGGTPPFDWTADDEDDWAPRRARGPARWIAALVVVAMVASVASTLVAVLLAGD